MKRAVLATLAFLSSASAQAGEFTFKSIERHQGVRTAFFLSEYPSSKKPFYFATTCDDVQILGVDRLTAHYMAHFGDEPAMQPIVLRAVTTAKLNCEGPNS